MTEISERRLFFKVNFAKPELISLSSYDKMRFMIQKPHLFLVGRMNVTAPEDLRVNQVVMVPDQVDRS